MMSDAEDIKDIIIEAENLENIILSQLPEGKKLDAFPEDLINQASQTINDELNKLTLPPDIREKYDFKKPNRTYENSKPKETITHHAQVFDLVGEKELFNKILNSNIKNVSASDPHWTIDNKCLVLLTWSTALNWKDPRINAT